MCKNGVRLLWKSALVFFTFVFIVNCGSPSQKTSDVEFARSADIGIPNILPIYAESNYLLNAKPGSSIYICEPDGAAYSFETSKLKKTAVRQIVYDAVNVWLGHLLRNKEISVRLANTCGGNLQQSDIQVRLVYKECSDKWASAFAYPWIPKSSGGLGINRKVYEIKFCTNNTSNYHKQHYFGLSLHEVGHTFGLCDQYARVDGKLRNHQFNKLCHKKFRSESAAVSIMNAGTRNYKDITDDDRLGIRVLSCLKGIKSSQDWAEKGDIIDGFYNDHYAVRYKPSGKEVVKTFADTIQMLQKKGVAFEPACLR